MKLDAADWLAWNREKRAQWLTQLGNDWQLDDDRDPPELVHRPSSLRFVVVGGGELSMGLSDRDVAALFRLVDADLVADVLEEERSRATPVHRVAVRPFLCATAVLSIDDMERIAGKTVAGDDPAMLPREEARDLARQLGLRLPTEAEWEWLARDGDHAYAFTLDIAAKGAVPGHPFFNERRAPSSFGVRDMFHEQWVLDEWHTSYVGAPEDSSAWIQGEPQGVTRGGMLPIEIMAPEHLLGTLAALRQEGGHDAAVRFAADLPP